MVAEGLMVRDDDDVRVLTFAKPPSNRLTPALRAALIAACEEVPEAITKIVLTASGPTFSSALPLDPDLAEPTLAQLCHAIETARVPVIAALSGLVLGPGAELAMAARARIAAPGMRIAFPEIALGLCPEGGTSRRLASRIGTAAALRLLLSGRAVAADEALALGLVDAVEDDPVAAARKVTLAGDLPAVPRADPAAVIEARRSHVRSLPAAGRIIACVEAAALLPVEAHQAFEAVAREDLEASPEAAALRSVAKAERRVAALPPALARARSAAPDRIALHGAAGDLVTLARLALARGLSVAWHHPDPQTAATSLAALDLAEAAELRAGRLTMAARAAGRDRLTDGGDAPLHVHADTPEVAVSGAAHVVLGDGGAFPGLALAPQGASCEVSLPPDMPPDRSAEGPDGPALALAALRRLGLQPVLVGGNPILGPSLVTAGRSALAAMAAAGVPKGQIAAALEGFGAPPAERLPDPMAPRRDMDTGEILARWLAALANEGMRLLNQGIARRPSDIDFVLVHGHGFPRARGGPMHLADRRGLMALRADLRRWAGEDPLWTPAPYLDRLIRDGLRLETLDRRV
jgi:3-hydroxyacyl-CoA dehydrogenase